MQLCSTVTAGLISYGHVRSNLRGSGVYASLPQIMKVFDENIPVSDDTLRKGLEDAVELIEKYGEHYWPIFERLEGELKAREEKLARLKSFKRRPKFQ